MASSSPTLSRNNMNLQKGTTRTRSQSPIYDSMEKLQSNTLKRHPKMDLNKTELLKLLSYLEGELQARDIVIATLKAEKAKQLLYQAKYGRFGLGDPFMALQRDSDNLKDNSFDEAAIKAMYDNQLSQLENLIATQRKAQNKMREQLGASDKRCHKVSTELEDEKRKHAQDTAQGDDVTYMLEKERERLRQEIDFEKSQCKRMEKDLKKTLASLEEERASSARHKQVALLLIRERKGLVEKLIEGKQKCSGSDERLAEGESICDTGDAISNKTKDTPDGVRLNADQCSSNVEVHVTGELKPTETRHTLHVQQQLHNKSLHDESRTRELQSQVESLQDQVEMLTRQLAIEKVADRGLKSLEIRSSITPSMTGSNVTGSSATTAGNIRESTPIPLPHSPGVVKTGSTNLGKRQYPGSDRSKVISDIKPNFGGDVGERVSPVGAASVDKVPPHEIAPSATRVSVNSVNNNSPDNQAATDNDRTAVFTVAGGGKFSVHVAGESVGSQVAPVNSSSSRKPPSPAIRGTPPPLPPNKPVLSTPLPAPTRDGYIRTIHAGGEGGGSGAISKPIPPAKGVVGSMLKDQRFGSPIVQSSLSSIASRKSPDIIVNDNVSHQRSPKTVQIPVNVITSSQSGSKMSGRMPPRDNSPVRKTTQFSSSSPPPDDMPPSFLHPFSSAQSSPPSSPPPPPTLDLDADFLGPEMDNLQRLIAVMQKDSSDSYNLVGVDDSRVPVNSSSSIVTVATQCSLADIPSPPPAIVNTSAIDALSDINTSPEINTSSIKVVTSSVHKHALSGAIADLTNLLHECSTDASLALDDGTTPLHCAAQAGNQECIATLLEFGANPNTQKHDLLTPVHLAAAHGHHSCLTILLNYGGNVHQVGAHDWSALHCASANGHSDCCQLLIENGADIGVTDQDGHSCLHLAAQYSHADCLNVILEHSTLPPPSEESSSTSQSCPIVPSHETINMPDKDGWTVGHWAASRDTEFCLSTLLNDGSVDLSRTDKWDQTVKDVASLACLTLLHHRALSTSVCCRVSISIPGNFIHVWENQSIIEPTFTIGTLRITSALSWDELDQALKHLLTGYFMSLDTGLRTKKTSRLDPDQNLYDNASFTLGLTSSVAQKYIIGHCEVSPGEMCVGSPYDALTDGTPPLEITIRTVGEEPGLESLAYETLLPVNTLYNYTRLVEQYKNVVFYGAAGTGKSYLASRLAQHIVEKERLMGRESDWSQVTCSEELSQESFIELLFEQGCLCCLTEDADRRPTRCSPILILDEVDKIGLATLFGDLLPHIDLRGRDQAFIWRGKTEKSGSVNEKQYYFVDNFRVICTMDRTRAIGLEQSTQQCFKWVHLRSDSEPIKNLLARHLMRRLLHVYDGILPGTEDMVYRCAEWVVCVWQRLNDGLTKLGLPSVMFGPSLLLECPIEAQNHQSILRWLTSIWNNHIAVTVNEAIMFDSGPTECSSGSAGQQRVASTALYVLMQRAIVSGCPLIGSDKDNFLSGLQGSNELDLPVRYARVHSTPTTGSLLSPLSSSPFPSLAASVITAANAKLALKAKSGSINEGAVNVLVSGDNDDLEYLQTPKRDVVTDELSKVEVTNESRNVTYSEASNVNSSCVFNSSSENTEQSRNKEDKKANSAHPGTFIQNAVKKLSLRLNSKSVSDSDLTLSSPKVPRLEIRTPVILQAAGIDIVSGGESNIWIAGKPIGSRVRSKSTSGLPRAGLSLTHFDSLDRFANEESSTDRSNLDTGDIGVPSVRLIKTDNNHNDASSLTTNDNTKELSSKALLETIASNSTEVASDHTDEKKLSFEALLNTFTEQKDEHDENKNNIINVSHRNKDDEKTTYNDNDDADSNSSALAQDDSKFPPTSKPYTTNTLTNGNQTPPKTASFAFGTSFTPSITTKVTKTLASFPSHSPNPRISSSKSTVSTKSRTNSTLSPKSSFSNTHATIPSPSMKRKLTGVSSTKVKSASSSRSNSVSSSPASPRLSASRFASSSSSRLTSSSSLSSSSSSTTHHPAAPHLSDNRGRHNIKLKMPTARATFHLDTKVLANGPSRKFSHTSSNNAHSSSSPSSSTTHTLITVKSERQRSSPGAKGKHERVVASEKHTVKPEKHRETWKTHSMNTDAVSVQCESNAHATVFMVTTSKQTEISRKTANNIETDF